MMVTAHSVGVPTDDRSLAADRYDSLMWVSSNTVMFEVSFTHHLMGNHPRHAGRAVLTGMVRGKYSPRTTRLGQAEWPRQAGHRWLPW